MAGTSTLGRAVRGGKARTSPDFRKNRNHLDRHVLPRFAGRPIADINSRDVQDRFAALHATSAFAAGQG